MNKKRMTCIKGVSYIVITIMLVFAFSCATYASESIQEIFNDSNIAPNYAIINSGKAVTYKEGYNIYRYPIDDSQIGKRIKIQLYSYDNYCPCIFSTSPNVRKGFIAKANDGDVIPEGAKWLITTSRNADDDRVFIADDSGILREEIFCDSNIAQNYAIINSGKAVTYKEGYNTYRYPIDDLQIGKRINIRLRSYDNYCPCIFSTSPNVRKGFIAKANDGDMIPEGAKWLITTSKNADDDKIYIVDNNLPITITKGAITFIDDDGYLEAMNNWEIINNTTGVKPTCALITGRVGNKKIVSWDDVQRLEALGFEFVSHTHNHINLTKVEESSMREDLEESRRILEEHHLNSKVLVYPYIAHNKFTDSIVSEYFEYGVTSNNLLNTLPLSFYDIKRYSFIDQTRSVEVCVEGKMFSVHPAKSVEEMHAIIDLASQNNAWLIFMCHFRNSYSDGYIFDQGIMDSVIDTIEYAKQKEMVIGTFGEIVSALGDLED